MVSDLNMLFDEILESNLFDSNYYKMQLNEKVDGNLLSHYLRIGYKEGLNPSKNFDGNFYLSTYDEVKKCGLNPLIHYFLFGKNENFKINPVVNLNPVSTRVLTKDTYNDMVNSDKYFSNTNRWAYFNDIIIELKKLKDCFNILEMGPYKLPLVEGEDVIDKYNFQESFPYDINKLILHDCSTVPYPIEDKEYDLVIACQVLEHLGLFGEQKKIFDELERISKKAIISLPYKWNVPNLRDHHMIDENVIMNWANGREPSYQQISGSRIIQIYDFD